MTDFTKYRGYPIPSSPRETSRGGSHSELLARAVAADFDLLDAEWTAEAQKPTLLMYLTSNYTGMVNSSTYSSVGPFTVEKQLGVLGPLAQANSVTTVPGGEGWYHVSMTSSSQAEGAITASAQHRLEMQIYQTDQSGDSYLSEVRYKKTFQTGSNPLFNELEDLVYLDTESRLRMAFYHTNTGSTVRVNGGSSAGTRIQVTKLLGDY